MTRTSIPCKRQHTKNVFPRGTIILYKIPRWFIYCPPAHGESTLKFPGSLCMKMIVTSARYCHHYQMESHFCTRLKQLSTTQHSRKVLHFLPKRQTTLHDFYVIHKFKLFLNDCYLNPTIVHVSNIKFIWIRIFLKSLFLHVLSHIHHHSVPMLNGWCTKSYLQY